MHQGETNMRLDREPSVRGRDNSALGDANELVYEPCLLGGRPDMLDDGVGMDDVEGVVCKRHSSAIGSHKGHLRVASGKVGQIGDPDAR